MSDQPDLNFDLNAELLGVGQPSLNIQGLDTIVAGSVETPPEPVPADLPDHILNPEVVDPQPIDQHADSGYRPVTGAEVKDYLDAKGMGLEGRPSKHEVTAFLAAKRGA